MAIIKRFKRIHTSEVIKFYHVDTQFAHVYPRTHRHLLPSAAVSLGVSMKYERCVRVYIIYIPIYVRKLLRAAERFSGPMRNNNV